jgi:hypothetical protein
VERGLAAPGLPRVNRGARLDHDLRLARALEGADEFFESVRGHDVFALGAALRKLLGNGTRSVVNGHREALALHIEDQIFSHHSQADETDIAVCRHV